MKYSFLVILSLLFNNCDRVQKKPVVFEADAPEILYEGRIDFSNDKKPSFCYSGVSIKTIFVGSALQMVLEDFAEGNEFTNYYEVIVDGKPRQVLEAKAGMHSYELISGLPHARHTLEIFKRTECMVGRSTFHGFMAPAGTVLEKPVAKAHRIEFIGDSYTCGYGNEVSIAAPPQGNPGTGFHSKNENYYLSYSAIMSRDLNTAYRCIAYSGIGMYRNLNGKRQSPMPQLYPRIFPDDENSVLWDVNKQIPELIIINLGANDFYPEINKDYLDDSKFMSAYTQFLKKIRAYYPEAKLVCVTGVSVTDAFPVGRNFLTRIQKDVKAIVQGRKSAGDKQVYYFNIDAKNVSYGEDWHATVATHKKMAALFTPFIKKITGW